MHGPRSSAGLLGDLGFFLLNHPDPGRATLNWRKPTHPRQQ
jgi:hypothetical protein